MSRQSPTYVLPCPGETDLELGSAAGVSFHAAGLGRQMGALGAKPGAWSCCSCSSSAGLLGKQVSGGGEMGSAWPETWLRCRDVLGPQLQDGGLLLCSPGSCSGVPLQRLYPEHITTLPGCMELGGGRGCCSNQRRGSGTRLSYC